MHDARRERAPTGACTQRSRATGSTKTTTAPLRTARAAPAATDDALARERRVGGPLFDVAKATKSGGAAKKCVERRENDARRDYKSTSNEKAKSVLTARTVFIHSYTGVKGSFSKWCASEAMEGACFAPSRSVSRR